MTDRRFASRLVLLAVAATITASCADTVVEVRSADGDKVNVDGAFETVVVTTLPIVGTTAELLDEMSVEMGRLSSQISGEGDEKATLLRLNAIWDVARPDVEATHPELIDGIDTALDMVATAVTRIRPADGDKALQIFVGLVSRYNA